MKYKLLATALTLIAAQTAMAAANPFPCPTVRALKDVGVSSTIIFNGEPTKEWSGIERSNSYNTGVDWTFFITIRGLLDKPKNEVLARTNAAISFLILEGAPYRTHHPEAETGYLCQYTSVDGSSDWAIAVTPTFSGNPELAKLLKR